MIVQCCACKRVRTDDGWIEVADPAAASRLASHGYCPPCAAKAFAEVQILLDAQEELPAA